MRIEPAQSGWRSMGAAAPNTLPASMARNVALRKMVTMGMKSRALSRLSE
jgi:hypothetical protein